MNILSIMPKPYANLSSTAESFLKSGSFSNISLETKPYAFVEAGTRLPDKIKSSIPSKYMYFSPTTIIEDAGKTSIKAIDKLA